MNRTLRVLQVEDSESDAALIVRELERAGYRVESERVETAADMRSALQRRPWDVVIADHHLPGLDAPGALDVLAEAGLDIPFIVVSGAIDEETAVMMMKAGAHDYINKGSLARLAPAVERETREADVRRQRKLLESELQQAQKMEAIGRIAGGVAHDFNNLLTAILGYAALLLDEIPPGDPRRADVEQIRVAGEAAASLTRQLLAFSRKQVLQPRVLDLREVVSGVEQILRRVIAKDIELVTEMPESLGLVCADPGQMQQVLMNLAINARDAMPSGGRLVIAAGDVDSRELPEAEGQLMKPGRYVALSVTDTGCGMADEVKERVFEPFFTTKGHGKGTGLGLSTVYGIVMQSSGHIRADSEQGKGSTFSIYLPAVEGEKPAVEGEKPAVEGEKPAVEGEKPAVEAGKPPVEAGKAPVEAGKAPAEAGKAPAEPPTMLSHEGNVPASVLVVEDDPVVRSLASLALRDAGHRVIHAASAEEASGLTITEPIDLLLCDVLLPGRTGPELVAELRERGLQVPVLFMTGYAGDAAGFQALLRSGADRIEKPFTPHRLRAKVREVLAASARAAG